jgi:hypothetical protein
VAAFDHIHVGDRVRLVSWQLCAVDDYEYVPKDMEGLVFGHGASGDQLWVHWDNGSKLSPVSGDVVEVI